MQGEWLCDRGGHYWRENDQVRGCQFRKNGHVMVVSLGRENAHVMVVVSLMEGEWSCYRGGLFNGGRMVMLQKRSF